MYIVPLTALPSLQPLQPMKTAGEPEKTTTAAAEQGQSFAGILREAFDNLQQTQAAAQEDAYQLAMGDVSSLHSLMINSTLEATAVETAVQLTSRAVSSYKEIMQMQI